MFENIIKNFMKKSLGERFLLVLGIFFFMMYFVVGMCLIVMPTLPIPLLYKYRVLLGMLLIVYSFFRFIRFFNSNNS